MSKPIKVYIAGPLTTGDQEKNVLTAMEVSVKLMDAGLYPFVPHTSWYVDKLFPRPYETWMNFDFVWLRTCDALLRLPGNSPGADREICLAISEGIPVYYQLEDLIAAYPDPISRY